MDSLLPSTNDRRCTTFATPDHYNPNIPHNFPSASLAVYETPPQKSLCRAQRIIR